jgi:small subunit ribosomal protein S4e
MAYIIRQTVSKTWPIPKKGTKYVVVPSHNRKEGIPLLLVMRDILGFVKTRKELKKILLEKKILINGREARDEKISLLLFDTLSIPALKKYYRVSISDIKKIKLDEIKEGDILTKISKIVGKKMLRGKKVQLNLNDGRNVLFDEKAGVGDSVVVNLKEGKIGKVLPVKKDSQVLIVKGKHMGRNGKILSLEDDEVLINTGDGDIKIQEEELIVLN